MYAGGAGHGAPYMVKKGKNASELAQGEYAQAGVTQVPLFCGFSGP
jgi:hypothetical protein